MAGISALLGIIGFVALVLVARNAVDRTFGAAAAADYSISDLSCEVTRSGSMEAKGKFTSKVDGSQAYNLKVDFLDADGSTKLGTDSFVSISSLAKDQSTQFTARGFTSDDPRSIQCKVIEVNYSPS